jgi:hypothetical protein
MFHPTLYLAGIRPRREAELDHKGMIRAQRGMWASIV